MNIIEYGKQNSDIIMLLHGGGLSWWNYRAEAELLGDRYHVVLPFLDGHAESDCNMFPEEKKREQREKQFPVDLQNAYELGKHLTEKAKEEGYNE